MAFMIFDRVASSGKVTLRPTTDSFSLAGYNLIHTAWQQRGSLLDVGWHVAADELIRLHFNNEHTSDTKRFVVDCDPNTTRRIGLVELLDIYAFTCGDGSGGPEWTPLMLRMKDIFYEEYDPPLDEARKKRIMSELPEPGPEITDFVEFLYLNGPRFNWNWGPNGKTNAVFIQGAARDYFRQFF